MKHLLQHQLSNPIPSSSTGLYCPDCGGSVADLNGTLMCSQVYDREVGQCDISMCEFVESEDKKALTKSELAAIRIEQINKDKKKLEEAEALFREMV